MSCQKFYKAKLKIFKESVFHRLVNLFTVIFLCLIVRPWDCPKNRVSRQNCETWELWSLLNLNKKVRRIKQGRKCRNKLTKVFLFTEPTKLEITFGNDLDRGFVAHNRSFAKKYRSGTQGRIIHFCYQKISLRFYLQLSTLVSLLLGHSKITTFPLCNEWQSTIDSLFTSSLIYL